MEQNLITDKIETNEVIISIIRSRPPSPQIIEQPPIINTIPLPVPPEPFQSSTTQSLSSSMSFQPSIRVEINEKHNSITSDMPQSRTEKTSSQIIRQNKQPIPPSNTPVPDQININRYFYKQIFLIKFSYFSSSFIRNNTNMRDSYIKQTGIKTNLNLSLSIILFLLESINQQENNESEINYFLVPPSTLVNQEQVHDPIQRIIEEHNQTIGFYRMIPNRRVLIPHKISMDNILADQSHIIINQYTSQSPMNLSDLNHNQYQLNEVEFVQLLSSLVIRGVQVHKQYEKFTPGLNSTSFTNVLNVSQMHLRSSSNSQQSMINSSSKLPLIAHQQPTARQLARIQSNIQAKATREGKHFLLQSFRSKFFWTESRMN
jgi:hypothetical protein